MNLVGETAIEKTLKNVRQAMLAIPIAKIAWGMAVFTLATPQFVHACPGCNAALNNSVGFGFNTSILFMMAMPFIVAGAIGVGLIYTYRRARSNSAFDKNASTENSQAKEKEN